MKKKMKLKSTKKKYIMLLVVISLLSKCIPNAIEMAIFSSSCL